MTWIYSVVLLEQKPSTELMRKPTVYQSSFLTIIYIRIFLSIGGLSNRIKNLGLMSEEYIDVKLTTIQLVIAHNGMLIIVVQ